MFNQSISNEKPLTIAMIDIDFFKQINDTYGHAGGDVALKHTAFLLRENLKEAEIISRFGGEEFCILLSGTDPKHVPEVFEDLRKAFESKTINFNTHTIRFTISIGVCTRLNSSLEEMVKQADDLLYQAKNSGRNQIIVDK